MNIMRSSPPAPVCRLLVEFLVPAIPSHHPYAMRKLESRSSRARQLMQEAEEEARRQAPMTSEKRKAKWARLRMRAQADPALWEAMVKAF